LFFFFQAEDGIRDLIVTGVQTCALPISENGLFIATIRACQTSATAPLPACPRGRPLPAGGGPPGQHRPFRRPCGPPEGPPWPRRSEERRVGKEGRTRGAADT